MATKITCEAASCLHYKDGICTAETLSIWQDNKASEYQGCGIPHCGSYITRGDSDGE